jgi:hypothetical protein
LRSTLVIPKSGASTFERTTSQILRRPQLLRRAAGGRPRFGDAVALDGRFSERSRRRGSAGCGAAGRGSAVTTITFASFRA